jgi:hypothetical protein
LYITIDLSIGEQYKSGVVFHYPTGSPMFVSIHLPKCAGQSLQKSLQKAFGNKIFLDYGDKILDQRKETVAFRAGRAQKIARAIKQGKFNFDLVHGHFYANKYAGLIQNAKWMTVARDPMGLLPSYYKYLRRAEHTSLLTETAKKCDTLLDFIAHPTFRNVQSKLLGPLTAADFHFIGLQEHFDLTMQCLSTIYGVELEKIDKNINPDGSRYSLTPEEKTAIIRYNARDLEFYASARNHFFGNVRKLL